MGAHSTSSGSMIAGSRLISAFRFSPWESSKSRRAKRRSISRSKDSTSQRPPRNSKATPSAQPSDCHLSLSHSYDHPLIFRLLSPFVAHTRLCIFRISCFHFWLCVSCILHWNLVLLCAIFSSICYLV